MNARGLRPPLKYSIFSYKAPTATAVLLAGDFTRWLKQPIAMHPEADGVWKTTVALPPGTYHYRFLVDGEWHADPECKVRVKNPFGSENDVIEVPLEPATQSPVTATKVAVLTR
jgi:1,4-alpha-glucan branching enzyme